MNIPELKAKLKAKGLATTGRKPDLIIRLQASLATGEDDAPMKDFTKSEDDKQKERIAAKNGLESYCFDMKSTMEDEKLKDKISEDEKKTIMEKCNEVIAWLDANQTAEEDEYKDKQKEVEAICNPIITKLYQSAGGAPGGMPGGMPGAGAAPGSGSGPTVEEVD